MKIGFGKIILLILFFSISLAFCLNCGKTHRITIDQSDDNSDESFEYYVYVADSTGMPQTVFIIGEDVFFRFGIINTGNVTLEYAKAHGGPTTVSFDLFKNDSLVGVSDYGYYYPAIVVPGEIVPGDTLQYSTSWYSNPYVDSLAAGNYLTIARPYLYIQDITPLVYLDSAYFEIIPE